RTWALATSNNKQSSVGFAFPPISSQITGSEARFYSNKFQFREDHMNAIEKKCKSQRNNTVTKYAAGLVVLAALVVWLAGGSGVTSASSEARNSFGFNTTDIAGFP